MQGTTNGERLCVQKRRVQHTFVPRKVNGVFPRLDTFGWRAHQREHRTQRRRHCRHAKQQEIARQQHIDVLFRKQFEQHVQSKQHTTTNHRKHVLNNHFFLKKKNKKLIIHLNKNMIHTASFFVKVSAYKTKNKSKKQKKSFILQNKQRKKKKIVQKKT